MDERLADLFIKAKARQVFTKEDMMYLLSQPVDSIACEQMKKVARELSSSSCKDRAYLWGAIGVDYKPCAMNCDFCSLGEAWGLVKEEYELDDQSIIAQVKEYAQANVRWIVLRTTEFYNIAALCKKIKKVRAAVPGAYELGLNIGELQAQDADDLYAAGVNFMYHSLRIKEGSDTRFDPALRKKTLQVIADSPLDLVFLVEPVGVEHTNEEIASVYEQVIAYRAKVSGVMARMPVEGTPLGHYPRISDERMAQIIAMTRLAGGDVVEDICAHPASKAVMQAGANVSVVEIGSIPRCCECMTGHKFNNYDCDTAKEWFEESGYHVCQNA